MGEGLEILCIFLADDKEKLWAFVSSFFKFGKNIELRPEMLIAPLLKYYDCKKIQESIWNASFPMKNQWQFAYYALIDDSQVTLVY